MRKKSNNQKIFNNTREGSKGGNVGPKKKKMKNTRRIKKQNGKIKLFVILLNIN